MKQVIFTGKNAKVIIHWQLQQTLLSFEWQLYHLDYTSNIMPCGHVRCLTVEIKE